MKIFSIIVSYNGERWIAKNLDSILHSRIKVYPIVVDNASQDDTIKVIKEKYPEIHLIEKEENLGFGKMSNLGIHYALSKGADYILLVNQDAKIDSFMLERMLTLLHGHPEFGIISPLNLDYEGKEIDAFFLNYISENPRLISDAILGRLQGIYEISFLNAAVWMLTRRFLEGVGGFDPLFFMYGEDTDLCRRARFHGYKIGVIPTALAYHWHMVNSREHLSIKNKSNWFFSGFVNKLKNPEHSFLRNLIGFIFACYVELERKLEIRDFKGFIATFYSILIIATKIFTIRKHYGQCKAKGCHWL